MDERLARLRSALAAERAWQRGELERKQALALPDQVRLGVAWPVLRVDDVAPAGRGRWRWTVRSRTPLHDGIGAGAAVRVTPAGGGAGWSARVGSVDARSAELLLDEDEAPPEVRVALRFDGSTWDRYDAALVRAGALTTPLAAALRGEGPWRAPKELQDPGVAGLHPAQARAVGLGLDAEPLACVHGPPGTGKTRTLVVLLQQLVRRGERPWALADSNAAVDHLAERASAAGLRVLRLGPPERVGARAAALTLDAALERHPLAGAIRVIDRELLKLRAPADRQARRALLADRWRLEGQAREQIFADAEVTATTLGTLARMASELPRARTAVIDEATQVMEPAAWVVAPWVERLVLAGDPRQLGPVVFQPGNPLGESLLARLVGGAPADAALVMLEEQHRMHGDLHALVQDVYGPRYVPHRSVVAADLGALLGPGLEEAGAVLTWVDTAGAGFDEARDDATGSLYNRGEGELVVRAVQRWRAAGLPAADIGVIAPYSAQVARLRDDPRLAGVEVGTVNAFQGREKEAVCVSFVRSNPDGELGFVADPRRLVVALTRARRAWVGVGDSATLALYPPIAGVLDLVAAAGGLRSAFEDAWWVEDASG